MLSEPKLPSKFSVYQNHLPTTLFAWYNGPPSEPAPYTSSWDFYCMKIAKDISYRVFSNRAVTDVESKDLIVAHLLTYHTTLMQHHSQPVCTRPQE